MGEGAARASATTDAATARVATEMPEERESKREGRMGSWEPVDDGEEDKDWKAWTKIGHVAVRLVDARPDVWLLALPKKKL